LLLDPDKFAAADPAQRRTLAESIGHQIGGEVKREGEEKAAENHQEVKPEAANAESKERLPISFERISRRMDYEDWDQRRCIRAVLPPGMEFSGFEQCGHIAHVNLRDPLLPFRFVIGQILLDKTARTR
jgi:tRNA G37 N-methylase Trm5